MEVVRGIARLNPHSPNGSALGGGGKASKNKEIEEKIEVGSNPREGFAKVDEDGDL